MRKERTIDIQGFKPDFDPVDFHALYLRGLDIAEIEPSESNITLGDIRGEGFKSPDIKDASLHTLHISRLLFS